MGKSGPQKSLINFRADLGGFGRMAGTPWVTFSGMGILRKFFGGWIEGEILQTLAETEFEFTDFRTRMDVLHGKLHGHLGRSYRALSCGL
jgi:hypothetical protein